MIERPIPTERPPIVPCINLRIIKVCGFVNCVDIASKAIKPINKMKFKYIINL